MYNNCLRLTELEADSLAYKGDISKVSPGAYAASSHDLSIYQPAYLERMNTDLGSLRKQYSKLKQRQQQAHVLLAGKFVRALSSLELASFGVSLVWN